MAKILNGIVSISDNCIKCGIHIAKFQKGQCEKCRIVKIKGEI